jgi:hypothetical protein
VALQQYYEMDEAGKLSPMLPITIDYVAESAKWADQMNPWMVRRGAILPRNGVPRAPY